MQNGNAALNFCRYSFRRPNLSLKYFPKIFILSYDIVYFFKCPIPTPHLKGANILIKMRDSVFFRSYLSDFGMSGARGGSPLHTSPEQLTEAVVEKSDIFALGTTIVKTVCDEEMPLVLISQPIKRKEDQKAAEDYVKNVPILQLAKRMLKPNPAKRPNCNEVNRILMTKFPKKEITRKWIEATMTKIKDTVTKINTLHLQKNTKAAAEMTR